MIKNVEDESKSVALLKVEHPRRGSELRLTAVSRQTVVSCGCLEDCLVAMATVELADLERGDGWIHVIVEGVSALCYRGSERVSAGGLLKEQTEDIPGVLSLNVG